MGTTCEVLATGNVTAARSLHRSRSTTEGRSSCVHTPLKRAVDKLFPNGIVSGFNELRQYFDYTQEELRRTKRILFHLEPLATTGEMTQSISHDLRNYLTAICSSAEGMAEEGIHPADRVKLLEEVRAAVHDMTGMLESLLLFARTSQTLRLRVGSLTRLIEHAVEMVRKHPDALDVEFATRELPFVKCRMDSRKIESAIYNLLLNACQAPKSPASPRRIEVTLCVMGDSIHARVVDNGPGVPAAIRRTLFRPFVSAGSHQGIGLGLTIAKRNLCEHGGSLRLEESVPGHTVFVLYLSRRALEGL
jgi:signal transduction histidine kinase